MTTRVINDPAALGWEFDATTGRWTWGGGGSSSGGGGGTGGIGEAPLDGSQYGRQSGGWTPITGGGGGGYDDTQIKSDLAQETQDRIDGDASLQNQINNLSGGGSSYGQWNLQASGGQPFAVTANEYVNFEGSGGIAVTRSGNYVTIDGSGISGGGPGGSYDDYQYWRYQVNGSDTTSVMSMNTINFRAGSNVTLTKIADGIEISATGGGTSYTLPLASSSVRGGVQVGFSTNAGARNYAVQLSGEKMYVNVPWTDSGNTTYSEATSSTYGLVKIGYSANGKNYPVQLSSGRMYVSVPWTDSGGTSYTAGNGISISGSSISMSGSFIASSPAMFQTTGEGSCLHLHTTNGRGPEIWFNQGTTTGNKFIRANPGGSLEVINGAYGAVILSCSDSGNLTMTGDVTAFSDARLKENIETLDGSKVYDMRGVSFTKDGRQGSGVIAQELLDVAPELVHEDGEYLSVAYGNLVGYLIEAVKDLKAEVEELKRGSR